MKTKNLVQATFTSRRPPGFDAHRGFTLVEIMVALTIGLIILAALAQLFASSRATSTAQNALARVQENARFAMEFISQDLRMAGYAGCSNAGSPPNDIVQSLEDFHKLGAGLRAHRSNCTAGCTGALTEWSPALPASYGIAGQVAAGSDVLLITRADILNTRPTGNLNPSNGNFQISPPDPSLVDNDILVVTDCSSSDVFRVNNVSSGGGQTTFTHPNSVNTASHLSKAYPAHAEIMRLVARIYFVGPGTDGRPTLRRKDLGAGGVLNPPIDLVTGIETMRAAFGIDTDATRDGIPNRYVPANSVEATAPGTTPTEDWFRVATVRIGFVSLTEGEIEQQRDTSIYHVLGMTATTTEDGIDDFNPADDRRQRRVFHETIRIRNR